MIADPGYTATAAMVVQSALCCVDEKDSLPPRSELTRFWAINHVFIVSLYLSPCSGGVYTPAVAFGNTKLIQNLENTGKVKFEVVPQ